MPNKGKIPVEDKVKIVESYLAGRIGYTAAHEIAGVGDTTLRRWINRYKMEGANGLLPSNKNRLYSKEHKQSAVIDFWILDFHDKKRYVIKCECRQ